MKPLNRIFPALLLVTCAGLVIPSCGYAQTVPGRGPIPFSVYDTDGNGLISEAEFDTVRQERMQAQAAAGGMMRNAANAPPFADFDSDSNGQLTKEELENSQRSRMQNRPGMRMGVGMGRSGGQGMEKGMRMPGNVPSFADCDVNGDGTISEAEFDKVRGEKMNERAQQGGIMRNAAKAPAFADIDTDGDGTISSEEFAAHQASQRWQKPRTH